MWGKYENENEKKNIINFTNLIHFKNVSQSNYEEDTTLQELKWNFNT